MTAVCVPCECCGGAGTRPLTQFEADTMAAVGSEWRRTPEIASRIRLQQTIKLPALCNRLVKLETLGLIERRQVDGRTCEWRTVSSRSQELLPLAEAG